jgi:hypothetical protein
MSTLKELRSKIGVSYLGGTTHSAKMKYSYNKGTMTYCVYLAPYNMSGYQVCGKGEHCHEFCLNGAGHNKADIIANGFEHSKINISRIKKTKAFYEQRETFMELLIKEIESARQSAKRKNMEFAVRLNGTSDLSPLLFCYKGKNILEIFPDVQFYDYTKVPTRFNVSDKYSNYDVTFSFDGYNWDECEKALARNEKVAVVFEHELPTTYKKYRVINANDSDTRFLDPKGTIMGLHYHPTGHDYVNGKYIRPNTKFIIYSDDLDCIF